MPRHAVTKRGDSSPLADCAQSDRNASLDTAASTPDTRIGVEDVFSSTPPSRKRAAKPIIGLDKITPPDKGIPIPPGTLYLVAVPIGCLEDISVRALSILRKSALILCENVSVSRSLTQHFGISTSLLRYGGKAASHRNSAWLDRLLRGENIAFVCDAGTPGIADPGQSLVRAALEHSIPVVALPGPVAALVALIASGLSTTRFAFDGFPPRSRADREAFFTRLAQEERTILLYESAGALVSTLKALSAGGNQARHIAVACHLTYPVETWFRGTLQEAIAHFRKHRPRGEYALVIEGCTSGKAV